MAENVRFRFEADDRAVENAIENLIDRTSDLDRSIRDVNRTQQDTFDEMADSVDRAAKGIQEAGRKQGRYQAQAEKTRRTQSRLNDAMRDSIRDVRIFGTSIGEVTDGLRDKADLLKTVTTSMGGATRATKAFRVALISTGIGAIVVALGSLVTFLTRTQRGIDAVNKVLAGTRAAFDTVIDRASTAGEALVNLFLGRFRKAAQGFGDTLDGLGEEIQNEVAAAIELEGARQRLTDQQRELNVEFANARARIEENRLAAENENLTFAERRRLLQEAIQLEQEFGDRRIKLAEENLRIIRQQNALSESTRADLEREAEAQIALAEIRQDVAGKQQADFAQVQQLLREEQQLIRELREEYNGLLDDLETRARDLRIGQLLGVDRLEAERELALQEINRFRQSVIDAAARAGQDLPATFEDDVRELIGGVQLEFRKGIDKLRENDTTVDPLSVIGFDGTDFTQAGSDAIDSLEAGLSDSISRLSNLGDRIAAALGLDQVGLQALQGTLGTALDSTLDGIASLNDAAISQQDEFISILEERVSATEAALQRELRLQEQGYANDVDALRQKLNAENEELEAAQNKRVELERKQARQQLAIDSALQASQLTLAIAKLLSSSAGLGPFGFIAAAAAGSAFIFSTIARARAQAQEASQPPEFREGGMIEGMSHMQGGRIIEAEGGEFVVRRGPAQQHRSFLEALNTGKYKGIDLSVLAQGAKGQTVDLSPLLRALERDRTAIVEMEAKGQSQAMREAYERAAQASADKMIEYWKSRPVRKLSADGEVIEWQEGNTKRRQTVKKVAGK